MGLYVTSTAPTSPYTGTPKLSPGTWYISFKSAQPLTSTDDPEPLIELFLQGGSSTPPVNNPPVVVNPIANYPIPEPCPNNTRFMKELMGGPANG